MARRIILSPTAFADLDTIHDWIARESARTADATIQRVLADLECLRRFPRSGRPAREQDEVGFELRQLTVFPFRVLYTIRDNDIRVLRIRHGSQADLSGDEIE